MAAPAAVLSIIVEARTAAATASLGKTQAQLAATGEEATAMNAATTKASRGLKTLGTVAKIGAAAGVAAFVIEAKKSVTTTQDLTKSTISLHKNLGLSNKVASEWAGLAKARGADTTKLGMAFKTLATQVSAAGHGSATSVAMFKELGFSQKDIQRAMTDTQFAVKKVSDGLNNLPAGADKATFSGKLFGRGWQTIAPILRDGSAAMQEQLDTVEKYGGVLEGKTLKQQEALLANIRENKIAWQGFQVEMAKFVTPALNDVSDQFQRIAKINADPRLTDTQKWSKIAKIVEEDMHKALGFVLKLIPQIASQVGQTAPKIAIALVQGFLHADVWGKLALGAWLITKFGLGGTIIKAIGSKVGTLLGVTIATQAGEKIAAERIMDNSTMFGNVRQSGEQAGRQSGGGFIAGLGKTILGTAGIAAITLGVQHAFTDEGGIIDTIEGHPLADPYGDLFSKMRAEMGDLNKAARKMSVVQREQFTQIAKGAADNGDITRRQFKRIEDVMAAAGDSAKEWRRTSNQAWDNATTNVVKDSGRWIHATQDAAQMSERAWNNATGNFAQNAIKWGKSSEKIKDQTTGDLNQAAQGGTKGAHRLYQGVWGNFRALAGAVQGGLQNIKDNTNKSLGAFGAKKLDFALKQAGNAAQSVTNFAQGGMMVPGSGSGDKVPLQAMVEPGEGVFVLNRNAMGYLQALNNAVPRFAQGGIVAAGHLAQRMGLTPSENPAFGGVTPGIHVPSSYHYKGLAIDVSGGQGPGSSQWRSYDSAVRRGWLGHGLAEEFYDLLPNYVKNDQIVPGQIGGHSDHIHVAIIGKALGVSSRVARQILKGGTATMRGLGQRALDMSSKAANAFIGRRAPTTGAETMPGFKGGQTVTASWYGPTAGQGPHPAGAGGVPLRGAMFAELAMGNALGHLPMGAKLRVGYKNKSVVARKEDIGLGGSGGQKIDLWWELAQMLNPNYQSQGLFPVEIKKAQRGGRMAKGGSLGQALAGASDTYHTQHLHPGHGAPGGGASEPVGIPFSVPKTWRSALSALGSIRGDERKWAELTDIATRHAGFPSSEAGTDVGPQEQKYLVAMNRNLLGDYVHERNVAVDLRAKMMKFLRKRGKYLNPKDRAWVSKHVANLKGRINQLQGITGGGGLILDVQETLAGLRAPLDTGTAATVDNSAAIIAALQSQLQGTQQALGVANVQGPALGAFAGLGGASVAPPSMPSVVGASAPVEVHNHFPDALAFLGDFVTTTVKQSNKQTVSAARRSIG